MKLLQTNNGRLRIDPSSILAIELDRPILRQRESLPPVEDKIAIIILERGVEIDCPAEEATEIALQWEQYMAELDPDDDEGDDEDDQDDDDEIEVPETIDITPISKRIRRRKIDG